jgi:hypothetical protein
MTVEKITALYRTRPFRTFDVFLADGRSLRVKHPEMLILGGRTCTIYVDPEVPEIVDLLLVTSLKPVKTEGAKPTNGN